MTSTDELVGAGQVVGLVVVVVVLALEIGLRLLVLGVIPRGRKPSVAMAWLLLFYIEPLVGLVVFRLFGSTRLGRKREARHRLANERVAARTEGLPRLLDHVGGTTSSVRSAARLNRRLGAFAVTDGNDVTLLPDVEGTVAAMVEMIDGARAFVHVEFYITAWDEVTGPVFDAMVRATGRGVDCRLLFDHIGSRGIPGYRDMLRRLADTEHRVAPDAAPSSR